MYNPLNHNRQKNDQVDRKKYLFYNYNKSDWMPKHECSPKSTTCIGAIYFLGLSHGQCTPHVRLMSTFIMFWIQVSLFTNGRRLNMCNLILTRDLISKFKQIYFLREEMQGKLILILLYWDKTNFARVCS